MVFFGERFLAHRRDSPLELGDIPVLHENFTMKREKAPGTSFQSEMRK